MDDDKLVLILMWLGLNPNGCDFDIRCRIRCMLEDNIGLWEIKFILTGNP